jgi:hypothetical protein
LSDNRVVPLKGQIVEERLCLNYCRGCEGFRINKQVTSIDKKNLGIICMGSYLIKVVNNMDLIFLIIITVLAGGAGVYALYHAFKPYKPGDKFFEGYSGTDFFLVEILVDFLLWLNKKIFPERFHINLYRVFAFIFGLLMFTIVALCWIFL